ncbi:MAG: Blue-light-activated protein [Syntrophorhabdus sp. PtaU1.Bin002]|nr:MAG: Blue-light-activated protein [Syntrophorhabdus sp. PtaU1.Bin002]
MDEHAAGPDGVDEQRKMMVEDPGVDKLQFAALVENVPVGIVGLNRTGAIVYCNPAFRRFIGYTSCELVRRNMSELLASDSERGYYQDLTEGSLNCEPQLLPCALRFQTKREGIVDARVDWNCMRAADGEVTGLVCSVLGMNSHGWTERVVAGDGDQAGYQDFVINNPEGIWRFECEEPISVDSPEDEQIDRFFRYARLADCNDALARMYGFEKGDDLIGVRLMNLAPGSQQRNIEQIRLFVRSGYRQEDGEFYEVDRFGNMHCFLMNALAFIEDGHIKQVWGAHRDITERKRSEQRIMESEQELRAILSASPIGILRVRNRVVDWANESMSRISGYTTEELKGKGLRFVYVSDEEYERAGSVLYREGQCKARYVRKDGSIVYAHVQASPADNDSYIVTVTDITRQKQIEDALRFTQFAVDRALDSILWIGRDGTLRYVNDGLCRSTGYSREELCSMTIHDIDLDFPEERWNDLWNKARNLGPLVFETHYRRKDRTVFPVEVSVSFLAYDDADYACAFTRDIAGRKQAEIKIAQAAREWQTTFDAITDMVMTVDGEYRITRVNKAAIAFFDRPAKEILGTRWFALMDGAEGSPETYFFVRMRSTKKTVATEWYDKRRGIWLSLSLDPILDDNGNVAGAVCIGKDITDRKLSEDALRESERKFRDLTEESGVGIYVVQDGIFRYANTCFAAIGGWRTDEVIDKMGPRDWTHPEDLPLVEENIRKRMSGETEALHYEFRIVAANKETRNVEVYGARTTYQGRSAVIGTLLDITDRKRAETELQHERMTFSTILRHHPFGIAQIDWKGTHLYINPAFTKITGYTLEDVPTVEEWFRRAYPDPDYRKEVAALWQKLELIKEESADAAFRIVCKDGKEKDIEFRATRVKDFVIVVFHDVTERRQAERALRESEEKYRNIFENAVEGVFRIAPHERFSSVNPAMARMFGFDSPEEFLSVMADGEEQFYVNPEDCTALKRLCKDMGSVERFEAPMHHKDGRVLQISINVRAVRDEDGAIICYEGTAEDITNRERAEEQLRAAHQQLLDIIEFLPDGTFVIDKDKKVVAWNHACEEMTGVKKEDIIGQGDYAYAVPFYGERRPILIDYVTERSDQGREHYSAFRRKGNVLLGEAFLARLYNGKGAYLSGHASPLMDKYGNVVGAIESLNDVTELKRLESQLRHAQKMEAVGQLAGGIAHDFNNILTAIMGYGNLLQMKIPENDPLKLYTDKILAVTQKAANLTQSLLAFSRKQVIELRPQKVNAVIREMEKLLERLLTEDIDLEIVFCDRDLTVLADITQIDQVLLNLVTNARDAMPKGGKLRIETDEAVLDEEFRRTHGYGEPGEYALISVSDTGIGIDDKVKEKIFEPFFTTKEMGRGTGLGLSIVYGIVKQHSGYIDVHSEQGRGTTFHIYLPTTTLQVEEKVPGAAEAKGGMETILVAEDNHDVRELIVSVLSDKGYTLVEAVDGKDAVEKFMKYKDTISLAVLDVVMPRKNGKEVYQEIQRVKPDTKVLFTSGYTGDVVLGKGIRDGALNFISKPLSPAALVLKVREILDKNG